MRIVILGISGMFGSTAFRLLSKRPEVTVYGTARSDEVLRFFDQNANIIVGVDVENPDALAATIRDTRASIVINCIGVIKQVDRAKDPLVAIPINAMLPHRIARLCDMSGARLIHISTDCVFSGRRGNYKESDFPDADDLYGRSKLLGEVDYPNAITLRTSIIGRELATRNGLVEWFLNAMGRVRGYTEAIFSGLTTDELTRVIADFVLPRPELRGLYHVSADAIDKYSLLKLIKNAYGLLTEIEPSSEIKIDRSLDSTRFREATGYLPPPWPDMIHRMHALGPAGARS
jgi:dTDP-4-dehydrorhamnose reductase